MEMKFDKLSQEDLILLKDPTILLPNIASRLGIGTATASRWRKKLGICLPRGSKKGKPKPWQVTSVKVNCKSCDVEIVTIPSQNQKYCSRECMYSNPEYIQMLREVDRSYTQTEEFALKQSNPDTPFYKKYAGKVHRLTRKVYDANKDKLNPSNHPRGLAGVPGAYHLDHIIPIRYGFDNKIPPEKLAVLENLQMLPWKENIIKSKKVI